MFEGNTTVSMQQKYFNFGKIRQNNVVDGTELNEIGDWKRWDNNIYKLLLIVIHCIIIFCEKSM